MKTLRDIGKPITKLSKYYEKAEELGRGGFGTVCRCIEKATKKEFAVKVIKIRHLRKEELSIVIREADICSILKHPNIVQLHKTLWKKSKFYFIFDLITGGELFEDIVLWRYYTEKMAKEKMFQLLDAVSYCHSINVIHHDIKPENLLLENRQPNANLKLADFGLSIQVPDNQPRAYRSGYTTAYAAPELLRGDAYNKAVDIWSCGVILYLLLSGYHPFWDNQAFMLKKMVIHGQYSFNSNEWRHISTEAKDLISHMLTKDFEDRITADEALQHRWLKDDLPDAQAVHLAETQDQLRKFNNMQKWKVATLVAIGASRLAKGLNASEEQTLDVDELSLAQPVSDPDLQSDEANDTGRDNHLDFSESPIKIIPVPEAGGKSPQPTGFKGTLRVPSPSRIPTHQVHLIPPPDITTVNLPEAGGKSLQPTRFKGTLRVPSPSRIPTHQVHLIPPPDITTVNRKVPLRHSFTSLIVNLFKL